MSFETMDPSARMIISLSAFIGVHLRLSADKGVII
jgi:hypothetical protein